MRLSINGSPNLFAIAARCKNEAVVTAEQVKSKVTKKVAAAKQSRQEFQAAITALQRSSKELGRSITTLQKALVEVQPTLIRLQRQLNHWKRTNEEPLARVHDILQKYQPKH